MAAEVHIIGQIESAYGFPDNRLACRWSLHLGLSLTVFLCLNFTTC
jgi:hypothetical protein